MLSLAVWLVHRPHTIISYSLGNAMNSGVTQAVCASLCREIGRPFWFPGSARQGECLTDTRLLTCHFESAAATPAARDLAFDVVNGAVFRWSWMWGRLAAWFGLEAVLFDGAVRPLEQQMAEDGPVWVEIATCHRLVEADLGRLASAWHTDADLGRPIEVVTDMSRSRGFGFFDYQATDVAFLDLFDRLRAASVIP